MNGAHCPTREQLSGYLNGQVAEQVADSIAAHLETCDACAGSVETLESRPDRLIEAIRGGDPQIPFEGEPECANAIAVLDRLFADGFSESDPGRDAPSSPGVLGRLREYQLLERLGEGGMGTVYKAMHSRLKRVVALKVLVPHRMNDPRAIARFHREMELIGSLDHRHLVRATDAGDVDGTHFLVMEFVEGLNLSVLVSRLGPLPVADACELVRQAALGLQHAHENQLVHRDIKPSNLILSSKGIVKILDLGLARLRDDEALAKDLTGTGQMMGTVDYMAPEQATDTHAVDIRADLYSLGCTLFKLLTGNAPFVTDERKHALLTLKAHLEAPVPSVRDSRDDVPVELDALVARLLAKSPDDRFSTPAEAAAALEPWCAGNDLPRLLSRARGGQAAIRERAETSKVSTAPVVRTSLSDTKVVAAAKVSAGVAPRKRAVGGANERFRDKRVVAGAIFGMLLLSAATLIYFRTGNGRVAVEVNEGGFTVEVDGETRDVVITSAEEGTYQVRDFELSAGKHKMEVKKDGFQTYTEEFSLYRHGKKVLTVKLLPLETTASSSPGKSGRAADADRAFAERTLRLGGAVRLSVDGREPTRVTKAGELPEESFQVTGLNLTKNFDRSSVESILAELGRLANVREVNALDYGTITDRDCAQIAQIEGMEALYLRGEFTDEGLRHLKGLKRLGDLNLTSADITDSGIEQLTNLSRLEILTISSPRLTSKSLEHIARIARLRDLTLRGDSITDDDLKHLAPLQKLNHLGFNDSRIVGTGLRHLRHLPLNTVTLNRSQLTEEGVREIAGLPSLSANYSVLGLNGTNISDEWLAELRQAAFLGGLQLSATKVTGEGFERLAGLEHLTTIELGQSSVTDSGLRHLKTFPKLTRLLLNDTEITDEGLAHLEEVDTLKYVNLTGTSVTSAGVRALREQLPNCAVTWEGDSAETTVDSAASQPKHAASPVSSAESAVAEEESIGPAGLIPSPLTLPGVKRWTLDTVDCRSHLYCVDWSPNGREVACGTGQGEIRIYNVESLELVQIVPGHRATVFAVAWSPDGTRLATGSEDLTVRIWNRSGELESAWEVGVPVYDVAWAPNGKRLACTAAVFEVGGGQVADLRDVGNVGSIAWTPDGQQLATSVGREIYLRDSDGNIESRRNVEFASNVAAVRWNSEGNKLAACGWSAGLQIWDAAGNTETVMKDRPTSRRSAFTWSPDSQRLAVSAVSSVRLVGSDGAELLDYDLNVGIQDLCFSPDGSQMAAACDAGNLFIVSVDGSERRTTARFARGGNDLAVRTQGWSADGRHLLTQRERGDAHLWRIDADGHLVLVKHFGDVAYADWMLKDSWSPDGRQFILLSRDAKVAQLWRADGSPGPILDAFGVPFERIAWSPDGTRLISLNKSGRGRLWNADGTRGPALGGHRGPIREISWNPDGSLFATGSADRSLRIWTAGGEIAAAVEPLPADILSFQWRPEGGELALAVDDGVVRLVGDDGSIRDTLTEAGDKIVFAAWSPDGRHLATRTASGLARIWQADGTPGPILKSPEDGRPNEALMWAPGGQRVLVRRGESGWNAMRFFDLDGTAGPPLSVPSSVPTALHVHWSPSGDRFLFTVGRVRMFHADGAPGPVVAGIVSNAGWEPIVTGPAFHPQGRTLAIGTPVGTLLLTDPDSGLPQQVAVLLGEGETATLGGSGELLDGNPDVVERELVYVVETESGGCELLKPSEFRRRFVKFGP